MMPRPYSIRGVEDLVDAREKERRVRPHARAVGVGLARGIDPAEPAIAAFDRCNGMRHVLSHDEPIQESNEALLRTLFQRHETSPRRRAYFIKPPQAAA
jgi:hypothetical protein